MTFNVAAESYDRFMGAWSRPLAPQLADLAGIEAGQRVIDVGCGPGSLTTELVDRVGAAAVAAVDPSEPFVEAARGRHPGVDVRKAAAEALPYSDGVFDAALAQLVVHFMADPVRGIGEMRRVTRPGGVVAACVWDHAGSRGPLAPFWAAARTIDPGVDDESQLAGTREGHLAELFAAVALDDIRAAELTVRREYSSFDAWWEPFTLGVGPAGHFLAGLAPSKRADLRARCAATLPQASFELMALAWAARGTVGGAVTG